MNASYVMSNACKSFSGSKNASQQQTLVYTDTRSCDLMHRPATLWQMQARPEPASSLFCTLFAGWWLGPAAIARSLDEASYLAPQGPVCRCGQ